ncbi:MULTISPECIES: hypothetical protein [Rhizobium/Agrobacterium group]|uniref:hypothetical protein n=1 Tax=Rhizobium/Agrobacterium group TaxID=227290 RepID=UPI001ADC9191|nr:MULTISPECIES: hypothetical protein [Rhizobium/Agrobacterium group]MBO9112682.1 hypothetical protein [Agrobacterium sp. S2/73]QXZ76172.1 hypothetical protein J5276_24675 [Agrobacterium sp. S7/73]
MAAFGVVDEVGDGVFGAVVGDAVVGIGRNTVAQRAVPTKWAKKPNDKSFEDAGGLTVIAETASRILDQAV